MKAEEKREIIRKFKEWFREDVIRNHEKNTTKLVNIEEFNINPILIKYLANYLEGDSNPRSIAKTLVYPRVLGTSITTTFGTAMQKFITTVLDAYGSLIEGIDIEFEDQIDREKKFCQLKSGPNALNKDDIKTVKDHFLTARRTATRNNLKLTNNSFVFCMIYGEPGEMNSFIEKVAVDYPVYIGREFWHRFTGDETFYKDLIVAIEDVAKEVNMKELVDEVIDKVAAQIVERFEILKR